MALLARFYMLFVACVIATAIGLIAHDIAPSFGLKNARCKIAFASCEIKTATQAMGNE